MVVNLRNNSIPENIILFSAQSATPNCYTHECRLDGKYATGIPTAVTAPASSVGAATHQHATNGVHCHGSASSAHTHTAPTNSGPATVGQSGGCSGYSKTDTTPHNITSASTSPSVTAGCSATHQHNAQNNDPAHKTIRHIRYTPPSLPLRQKQIPPNIISIWGDTIASIPSNFGLETTHYGKYLKQTACCATSPGSTAGSNCHTHGANATHTHTVTVPAHGHTISGNTSTSTYSPMKFSGGSPKSYAAHNHPVGTAALATSTSANNASGNCSATHTHGAESSQPANFEVALIQPTTINLRTQGLPINSIGMWLEALGCISPCFGVADATGCTTVNLLAKTLKVIPCGGTNPGTTGGSNSTHTQASDGAHTHTYSVSHSHTKSGTTSCDATGCTLLGGSPTCTTSLVHNHTFTGTATDPIASSLSSNGAHTHSTGTIRPASIEVAYIQRI